MEDSNPQETITDLHVGFLDRCATVTPIFRIAELPFCGTFIGVISQPDSRCRRAYLPFIGSPNVTRRTVRVLALVGRGGIEPPFPVLQTGTHPSMSSSRMEGPVGFEPTPSSRRLTDLQSVLLSCLSKAP